MATWNTRGLRGSTLEELINRTNEFYLEKNLAFDPENSDADYPIKDRQGAPAHHSCVF